MSHPILIAALAEDRHRQCPCGAVAQQPCGPYRKCQTAVLWRRESACGSRRTATDYVRAGLTKARLRTWITPLLQIISKGAEN